MSSHGMRISVEGVDVKTGDDKDMVLTTKYSMFKGSLSGTGSISVERDGTEHTVTIPHGLSYVPMVQAFFNDPNGSIFTSTKYFPMSSFPFDGVTLVGARVKADSTNVYLIFTIEDL